MSKRTLLDKHLLLCSQHGQAHVQSQYCGVQYYSSSVGRFCCECRDRAEQKRLKRQLNKERRGAMRELRKDAVFLSDEKDKEKAQAKAERAGAFQKNMSFLQQQESDFKSGGQGGMWKKGKGKGKR